MLLLVLASLLLEPAVTTDGKLIIVPYVAGDGARGAENYELRTYNRNGTLVATHVVRTVDDEDGAPVIASVKRVSSATCRPCTCARSR